MRHDGPGPFAWVSDREVDLLLCAELHGSAGFASHLLAAAGLPGARFRGATMAAGDRPELVIEAETAAGAPVAVFVANRIAGAPRPPAAPADGPWAQARSLLMAPDAATAAAYGFDRVLTYESLIGWLGRDDSGHGRFLATVLRSALDARAGRTPAAAEDAVAEFWAAYWAAAQARCPQLRMKRPDEIPAGRTWPWFAEADGLRRGIALVHKTDRGAVDLTFASTPASALRAAALPLLQPGLQLHQSRKQALLRIEVPIVNMHRPFAPQLAAVEAGLDAAERQRRFFAANADALDIVPLI